MVHKKNYDGIKKEIRIRYWTSSIHKEETIKEVKQAMTLWAKQQQIT